MVAQVYEENSREGVGDFNLTHKIEGYWDKANTEIDLVAIDETTNTIRFGSCKRNPDRLQNEADILNKHIDNFLENKTKYKHWKIERVGISLSLSQELRNTMKQKGLIPQDLFDLLPLPQV